jgi:transposase-like protein
VLVFHDVPHYGENRLYSSTQVCESPKTRDQAERLKQLERENRELKQANEILRKAAAFFAQAELDRKPK